MVHTAGLEDKASEGEGRGQCGEPLPTYPHISPHFSTMAQNGQEWLTRTLHGPYGLL